MVGVDRVEERGGDEDVERGGVKKEIYLADPKHLGMWVLQGDGRGSVLSFLVSQILNYVLKTFYKREKKGDGRNGYLVAAVSTVLVWSLWRFSLLEM